MSVREDVAAHAADLRVVGRNGSIEISSGESCPDIATSPSRAPARRLGEVLRVIGVAPVCAEVAA